MHTLAKHLGIFERTVDLRSAQARAKELHKCGYHNITVTVVSIGREKHLDVYEDGVLRITVTPDQW
jgi:hypothetical protein